MLEYKSLLGTDHHVLDAMHAARRPSSEANNFGFFFPFLCHEITDSMFSYSIIDEEPIDDALEAGTMKINIGSYKLRGTGEPEDRLTRAQIKELKTVRFNKETGKKEGGLYYQKWTIRKYFRKPETMASRLTNLKKTMQIRETERARVLGRKHRNTMTDAVYDALDQLAKNAPHLYDVGDPYEPDGKRNGAAHYRAARGTNLTETINSLFSNVMRGGNYSLVLAVAVLMSALTVFNTDRRRALGLELDFVHHNRRLIEDINEISLRLCGKAIYDGERRVDKLRVLLPESGARFVAPADFSAYEPHARLRARNQHRLSKKRRAEDEPQPDEQPDAPPEESPPPPTPLPPTPSPPQPNPNQFVRRSPREHVQPPNPAPVASVRAPVPLPPSIPNLVRLKSAGVGSRQTSSKAAYRKVHTKRCGLQCSDECKLHYRDHVRKHANNKVPGRGFHHLGTCPVKQEADRLRRAAR